MTKTEGTEKEREATKEEERISIDERAYFNCMYLFVYVCAVGNMRNTAL